MPDTLKAWNTASMAVPIYMKWLKVLSFKENVKPSDRPYWIFPTRPCQLHFVMSKCRLDGLESESLWRRAFRSTRVNTCRAAFTHEGRRWSVAGLVSSLTSSSSGVIEEQAEERIQKILRITYLKNCIFFHMSIVKLIARVIFKTSWCFDGNNCLEKEKLCRKKNS